MAKEYAKGFYNNKIWKACRNAYIQERIAIDGGLCEVCHNQLGYIVHHKTELTEDNIDNTFVTLNKSNLLYVCKDCHDDIHLHSGRITIFDENGNLIEVLEN